MPHKIPFYNPIEPAKSKICPHYRLIMPLCAVGNIGQLACDLLISTLLDRKECHLIGRIYSPALMSVVGPNAFALAGGGPPTTSTEVYESQKHKLIIIQQRTSYFKELKQIYINQLVDWIKESQFDYVLVLTSSFAQCNPDTSLLGTLTSAIGSIQYISTGSFNKKDQLTQLKIKPIPSAKELKVVQEDGLTYLPGSGMTKPLLRAFERAKIPAAFLVDFCSEGTNIEDSYEVVRLIDSLEGLDVSKTGQLEKKMSSLNTAEDNDITNSNDSWVQPFSWIVAQECQSQSDR